MVRVWIIIGAVIAIVFASLAYSAGGDLDDAVSNHANHDLIPPFRG
jgi:hypothetical protein